jgi:hypothetical protein
VQKEDVISLLKDSFLGNFTSIKIIPVTEAEKKCTIHCLYAKTLVTLSAAFTIATTYSYLP